MIVTEQLPRVLICDDDPEIHVAIKSTLRGSFDFKSAYTSDEALVLLRKSTVEIALLDLEMQTPTEGLEAIPKILELDPEIEIIFYSGITDFERVKRAIRMGAQDYIVKDCGPEALAHVFAKALEHRRLRLKQNQVQHEIRTQFQKNIMVGSSPAMLKIHTQIERARKSPASVLIVGETGTGKEVVARLLRKTMNDGSFEPFVSVDSSTIQSSVAESILFGYEKGAFTGADRTTRGLFEEADGGAIYFDELANMPLEIQNKLLRAIQEKEVLRIGSSRPLSLKFRVISATNRDLEQMAAEGKFKDDLYQRLNVIQISIPPLRERREDIPLLLHHFIEVHSNADPKIEFREDTLELIQGYPFPGNVRELSNLVLHLYSMSDEKLITPDDLPPKFKSITPRVPAQVPRETPPELDLSIPFYQSVERFEKAYLSKAFHSMSGNISRMSLELQMDRSYLHRKLKVYGIHPKSPGVCSPSVGV